MKYKAAYIKFVLGLVLICLVSQAFTADTNKGVVVYDKKDCNYFIVQTEKGYSILEWCGQGYVKEDDHLSGDLQSKGMKDIINVTRETKLRIWVEDSKLSRRKAVEKYYKLCYEK